MQELHVQMNNVATFVTVGNGTQSFHRMLDAVAALLAYLPQPVVVQHGNSPFHREDCICRSFIEMNEFNRCIAEAELLLVHAGAGSVIHAIQAGKTPVVMPRLAKYGEVIDDHQLEFARALARAGKIVIVEEPSDLIGAVAKVKEMQSKTRHPQTTSSMVGLVSTALREYAEILRP